MRFSARNDAEPCGRGRVGWNLRSRFRPQSMGYGFWISTDCGLLPDWGLGRIAGVRIILGPG
eukprot:10275869-Alexandrium_andersonii.AAC.1